MTAPTVLAVQKMSPNGVLAGLKPTMVAPDGSNGNGIPNNGAQYLLIQNSDSADHTCTLTPQFESGTPAGLTVDPLVVNIVHGTVPTLIGPLPPSIFNTNGQAIATWSSAVGMTVAVIQFVPNPG
jgi:hypothetical protein